ncbi:helix-turn-helix domain-containing protein [Mycobacterium sp. C31M]
MHSSLAPTLADTLATHARRADLTGDRWPSLTIARCTKPTTHRIESLALIVVVHDGGTGMTVAAGQSRYRSPDYPALLLALNIEPQLVRMVATTMRGPHGARPELGDDVDGALSVVDEQTADTVIRLLRSLSTPSDRRVLAPLHLQEVVYRILQGVLGPRLIRLAELQAAGQSVAGVLDHIASNLGAPLTVEALAARVNLSTSAFSRAFRGVTGQSPYQYVKHARLVRGRELLGEGRLGVAEVSRAVGYSSASHFIKEFRSVFGDTPGEYVATQSFRVRVAV